jgi:hypothetical protein
MVVNLNIYFLVTGGIVQRLLQPFCDLLRVPI